jgi:hypothetical protein
MPDFYRVLYSTDHFRSYRRRKLTSHHHHEIPPVWQDRWYVREERVFADADRRNVNGTYSEDALRAFLEIAPRRPTPADWTPEEITLVSELEGLCAFTSAQAASIWGQRGPFALMDRNRYVEFEGTYVCNAPDGERGGEAVQASFIRWLSPLPRLQTARGFSEKHGLGWIPPQRF